MGANYNYLEPSDDEKELMEFLYPGKSAQYVPGQVDCCCAVENALLKARSAEREACEVIYKQLELCLLQLEPIIPDRAMVQINNALGNAYAAIRAREKT